MRYSTPEADSVSTHSRPKAAGSDGTTEIVEYGGFNTQPPEGGWDFTRLDGRPRIGFNTQPPEGGWVNKAVGSLMTQLVSTHSRPKAAGASLKSLAPSGFAAPISLSSQEKREREYNTAFSVTPVFAIS